MRRLLLAAMVTVILVTLGSQAAPAQTTASGPAPRVQDVSSMDSIVAALYGSISGGRGVERDWNRFRSLFAPDARLIPTGRRADGTWVMRTLSPDDYVAGSGPQLIAQGFFEREIARTVDQFGNIAHIFSTYESRRALEDAQPFARGINSIQLRFDGQRWWIVSVFWEGESATHPIPAKYLPPPRE